VSSVITIVIPALIIAAAVVSVIVTRAVVAIVALVAAPAIVVYTVIITGLVIIQCVVYAVVSGADPATTPAAVAIHGLVPIFLAVVRGAILGVRVIRRIFLDALLATAGAVTSGGAAARRCAEQGHHHQPGYDQLGEPPAAHRDAVGAGGWHLPITVMQSGIVRNWLMHRVSSSSI
jgi:hypothetical protein